MGLMEKIKNVLSDQPYGRFNQAIDVFIMINMYEGGKEGGRGGGRKGGREGGEGRRGSTA